MAKYTDIKQVRATNGQQFIDDFNAARSHVCASYVTGRSFEVLKMDLWETAKTVKVHYTMQLCPWVNERLTMTIL
jgi:hypothetical protein